MKKANTPHHSIRWPRASSTDWELNCPSCQRTLGYQPIHVSELREPRFQCLFCGKEGEAIWNRDGRSRLGAK
jgi:hypothetical protein